MQDEERRRYEERIAVLEAAVAQRDALIAQLSQRVTEREARLSRDSRNSRQPPASDGLKRRTHPGRPQSARKSGGQPGHAGHTLERAATPDHRQTHRPAGCAQCQHDLSGVTGQVVEWRQVQDGYATVHPATSVPKRRGRSKHHPAKTLLDALGGMPSGSSASSLMARFLSRTILPSASCA